MREQKMRGLRGQHRTITARILTRALAVMAVVAVWWMVLRPGNVRRQLDAVCRVEGVAWYDVTLACGDTLRMSLREGRLTDAEGNAFVGDTTRATGLFVSAEGHVVTSDAVVGGAQDSLAPEPVRELLVKERDRLSALAEQKAEAMEELAYYERTHTVTDDGYNEVMDYKARTEEQSCYVEKLVATLDSLISTSTPRAARLRSELRVTTVIPTEWEDDDRTPRSSVAYKDRAMVLERADGMMLLQTRQCATPERATHFALWAETAWPSGDKILMAWMDEAGMADVMTNDSAFSQMPQVLEGAALTNARGALAGIRIGDSNVPLTMVRNLCRKHMGAFGWWWANALADVRRTFVPPTDSLGERLLEAEPWQRNVAGRHVVEHAYRMMALGDSLYAGRIIGALPEGMGTMVFADGNRFSGSWHKGHREGYGVMTDTTGCHFAGIWHADSLAYGTAKDSLGTYEGEFNAQLERHGSGVWRGADGTFYCGEWEHGRRQGFGFAVGERKMVRAGIWKNDNFRGEQMIYTADRVYGIDISRYQHESGRKRYGIDWGKLRISSLGAANAARIRGHQDYPVSFVYIKASQGIKIKNRYYAADVAACRKKDICVGAYHFFTTNRDGLAQAKFFMKTAKPRKGDLPPVLDVEPSDAQIAAMGGSKVMFREILEWMNHVRAQCGTNPVLYVSQSFVNKYMDHAPEELGRYQVWIARYGEYKPYVHLLYWQLSPRGRVTGIRGDVDINVFNGSKEQFKDYVTTHGVKR